MDRPHHMINERRNPTTEVGVVEPMRTEANHQGHGLAKHILTSGIERLALSGAKRIEVRFEPGNPAAKRLYLGAGFKPDRENDILSGPTSVCRVTGTRAD